MSLIPTFIPSVAGGAPNYAAAAAADTAAVGPGLVLIVKNASGSSVTVTIATPGNLPTGDAYPDKTYTVAATTGEQWIPLLTDYRDPADTYAHISYSATTSVTRAVVRNAT